MNKGTLGILGLTLLLAACGGDQFGDIKQWMTDNTQSMRGKVEPLPEFKAYQPVTYAAFDQADPFNRSKMAIAKHGTGVGKPDDKRPKETLEAYDLEKLRMVGTLQQGKDINALVRSPDGNLYKIKVGSYLGQNFGMVTKITETEVSLKEIVEDSSGDWVERTSALTLDETEQKK